MHIPLSLRMPDMTGSMTITQIASIAQIAQKRISSRRYSPPILPADTPRWYPPADIPLIPSRWYPADIPLILPADTGKTHIIVERYKNGVSQAVSITYASKMYPQGTKKHIYNMVETCSDPKNPVIQSTRKHTPQENPVISGIHSKRGHNQYSYRKIGINPVIPGTYTDVYVSGPKRRKIAVSALYDWIYTSWQGKKRHV